MKTTIKKPVAIQRPLVTNHRSVDAQSEVVGNVYKTTNYDMFGHFEGNRQTNEAHIKNLMESIAENQLPVPIVTDEILRTGDGQNRLEACRRLRVPVYYIIIPGMTLQDVKRLNSNVKTWSWQQHMESFINLGYEDYRIYKEFYESYEINHTECMQLLLGHTSQRYGSKKGQKTMARAFADGQFKVVQYNKAVRQANMITKVKPYFEDYTHHHFIRALIHLFDKKQDVYSHDVFLKKLEKRNSKLLHQRNRNDYLRNIEEIYNKGSRKKVRLFEYTD